MSPVLSLSTSWCSQRHTDGRAMLREMAELGFTRAELSHGIGITLVPGILRAVEEGVIEIASTHNFCPLPTGVNYAAPNLFEPSTRDRREHDQWVRHTRRSIDFAAQVGARVLVCHLGSVRRWWYHPTQKLDKYLFRRGPIDRRQDPAGMEFREKLLARLRDRSADFWARTQAAIFEVAEYAEGKRIRLGLENREKLEELPLDEDFAKYFATANLRRVGYWHDTGHAQIKADLGMLDHEQQLAANADSLAGYHLHDVNGEGHDHQPVGSGHVDFRMVKKYFRPEHILVLELSPRVSAENVVQSKENLERLITA